MRRGPIIPALCVILTGCSGQEPEDSLRGTFQLVGCINRDESQNDPPCVHPGNGPSFPPYYVDSGRVVLRGNGTSTWMLSTRSSSSGSSPSVLQVEATVSVVGDTLRIEYPSFVQRVEKLTWDRDRLYWRIDQTSGAPTLVYLRD